MSEEEEIEQEKFDSDVALLQSPSDEALMQIMGVKNFNNLNEKILEGVLKTYKQEMEPECKYLIENDKILGRFATIEEQKNIEKNGYEVKDPSKLSTYDLYKEINMIQGEINRLKSENAKSSNALYLLKRSQEGLDLDIGFRSVELIMANDDQSEEYLDSQENLLH